MLEDDADGYEPFSGTLLLFMSDGSILRSKQASDAVLDPLWSIVSDEDIKVNDKIEYKGETYYATSKGLMKIDPVTGHLMCVGCFFDESSEDTASSAEECEGDDCEAPEEVECEGDECDFQDDGDSSSEEDAIDPESEIKHISIYDGTLVYGNAKG